MPGPQFVHAVAGLESRSASPGAHGVQEVLPAAAYSPVPHPVQTVDASESASTVPAAQVEHDKVSPPAEY